MEDERAADLFGRRKLYLLGLALFTLGSLLAGLASTAAILLMARAMQGLGAAAVIPAEQSLLITIFTDPQARNRAFGIWSAVGAAGGAFGVVLGGILTQLLGWPAIFLINVPIGAVVLLLSSRFVPESREERERKAKALDVPGILTVTPALLLLAYGPELAQTQGFSLATLGVFMLVIALLLTFVWIEARSSAPLVPLRLFRLRDLNGANLVSFMVGATHGATSSSPAVGVERDGVVYELFISTLPSPAFTASDVLDLYLHRGSFETVLADEDEEQNADRWYSHTPCGQELAQILTQWVWNIRLELVQLLSEAQLCTTEFAPALEAEPAAKEESVRCSLYRFCSMTSRHLCRFPTRPHRGDPPQHFA